MYPRVFPCIERYVHVIQAELLSMKEKSDVRGANKAGDLLQEATRNHYAVSSRSEPFGEMVNKKTIPAHVEKEFRHYLDCGILANGFARIRCEGCGYDFLVAFSCKGRGLCPSCNTKHMVQTAGQLVDSVFPAVPVRQWVLSLPKRVRYYVYHSPKKASPNYLFDKPNVLVFRPPINSEPLFGACLHAAIVIQLGL